MPHTDVDKSLDLAMCLDIPFWPQLPNLSFREDMYAQAASGFPGVSVRSETEEISFSFEAFEEDLSNYAEQSAAPGYFALSRESSATYHRFLERDLRDCVAIRGQTTGPVSFGFRVVDRDRRPIIYDEEVRAILFDFGLRKVNAQYTELVEKNENAFVWIDEPGLGWVLSGLSGYGDVQAKEDYGGFLDGIRGPKAMHLCANINLPYLFELGFDLISFDAYQILALPKECAIAVAAFLQRGGTIAWGIVPTNSENLYDEAVETLADRLGHYWEAISRHSSLDPGYIAERALIAPARCCLKNISQVGSADVAKKHLCRLPGTGSPEESLVEDAFNTLKKLSQFLRYKYNV